MCFERTNHKSKERTRKDARGVAARVAAAGRRARHPVGSDQRASGEQLAEALGAHARPAVAGAAVRQAVALLGGFFAGREIGASLVGVGLTGGIATGKSTVSKTFQEAGAVIVDADVIARQVVMPGQGAHKAIVKAFGEEVLNAEDKTLNRAKLGSIIFSDPAKRKLLNACTHKFIIWEMFKQLAYNRLILRKRVVVFDAPLLFETSLLEHFCYPTIVVACSEANELDRLVKRDNISQEDAEKRVRSQMKLHEKVKKANLVIHNDGTLGELLQNARQMLQRTATLVGASKELKL